MKKKAFLVLFTILVFLISGCQPTPDKKIVIGKNDELDSKLQETVEEDQLVNEGSGEKYWEETLVKKNITVIGNAKYTAPQSAKFPVYRAIPVFFSEDQAHEIVNKIWGDSEYYCDNEKTITKSELEKDIVQYREILNYWENELKQKDSDYTAEEIQKQISEYQILISQLESDYQNAQPGEEQTHLEKNFSYQDQGVK